MCQYYFKHLKTILELINNSVKYTTLLLMVYINLLSCLNIVLNVSIGTVEPL